ncbi:MAG: pitrilysin family protein [Myxococcota bacterium]
MLAHQNITLDNGLRVITATQTHLRSVNVSLFMRCGSRHETDHQWGLTHLLEHMLFRGSHRYPDTRALARTFERSGGMLDASTWRDHTSFVANVHPACLTDSLNALADMVQHPRFVDLDIERNIVGEELLSDLDENGHDTDISNLSRARIWSGHSLGRRIVGSFESLNRFNVDDLIGHHAAHYTANNAVLCVSGNVEHARVQDLASELFCTLPRNTVISEDATARFAPITYLEIHEQEGSQLDLQLTFEALPDPHEDFPVLELLVRVLDDGIDSRLHQTVCEKRGLVYNIETGLDCYADCGLYDIEMSVTPERAAAAVDATLETLECLCEKGVDTAELAFVKRKALYDLEFSIDSPEEVSRHLGATALFGGSMSFDNAAQRIKTTTAEDLRQLARRIFYSGAIHVTAMGPAKRANIRAIEKRLGAFAKGGG